MLILCCSSSYFTTTTTDDDDDDAVTAPPLHAAAAAAAAAGSAGTSATQLLRWTRSIFETIASAPTPLLVLQVGFSPKQRDIVSFRRRIHEFLQT